VLGNHDRPRIASRVGKRQAAVAAMLLLTFQGYPTIYCGDELGMHQVEIPHDRVRDSFERNVPGIGRRAFSRCCDDHQGNAIYFCRRRDWFGTGAHPSGPDPGFGKGRSNSLSHSEVLGRFFASIPTLRHPVTSDSHVHSF
jgi:glycosidase